MSSAQVQPASDATDIGTGPFVINLCSSTTPMALAHPQAPELKRFTFFMSRRREDGRERFRLHMGYFTAIPEAEEWLAVVRDIYPGAWVGEAPGKRLREKAKAEPVAVPVASPVPPAAVQPPAPAPVSPPDSVPTLQPLAKPAARSPFAGSNVREVLAQLDSSARSAARPSHEAPAPARAGQRMDVGGTTLTDTQVLAILEERTSVSGTSKGGTSRADAERAAADRAIEVLKPDDTVTRRVIADAVRRDAPVAFAVQLQWSVQPIELDKVPPLAIFSAYTLYTVDGNRDGRRWFGLRLGFFTDAISAKQVAQYVRSEFASVAVVPVTAQEQERATGGESKPLRPAVQAAPKPANEIRLIDDVAAPPPAVAPAPPRKLHTSARQQIAAFVDKQRQAQQAPVTPARAYRAPQTLEETLEILGAGDLEIDKGRGELIDSAAVRHLSVSAQKNSPFSKLLDRIAEKVRGERKQVSAGRR